MSAWKRKQISIIVFTISVVYIWFITLDLSRLFSLNYSYDIYPSALLKRISVILAAIIVWNVGRDGLNLKDSRRMKAAFVFVCMGEAAFVIGVRAVGVGMFAICQTLLIIRNSTGLNYRLAGASRKQKRELFAASYIVLIIIAAFQLLSRYLVKPNDTVIAVYLYGILLCISIFAAFTCNILGLLPKKNSRMVVYGMAFFFCCDVLVGLDAVLETGLPWLLSNSFIWVFYIPALVMLALSCYRYD